MFKFVVIASIASLAAACSTSPTYSSRSTDGSSTTSMGAPRSPGEGPSFNPYYGGAAGN